MLQHIIVFSAWFHDSSIVIMINYQIMLHHLHSNNIRNTNYVSAEIKLIKELQTFALYCRFYPWVFIFFTPPQDF